jgi:hypothetical protein
VKKSNQENMMDQQQLRAVLLKAVDVYMQNVDDHFEPDAYKEPKDVVKDFDLLFQSIGYDQLDDAAKIDPSYQELLDWLDSKGKSEQDLFWYWAWSDYEAYQEMTRSDMTEMLVDEGAPKYDRSHVMQCWVDMDSTQKDAYKDWMNDYWSSK